MDFSAQIPVHQVDGMVLLWHLRGYGLSKVWFKRGLTVLQAALMLRKHIASINDSFSHKLEMMLGSFGQWTHAIETQGMKETKLTNYFVYN
jgi:hypothetical protein